MPIRPFLFIFIVVFCAFFNSLNGNFLADDEFVIVENEFYTSFSHLKYLFTKQYFLNSDQALSHGFQDLMSSGSVAYRPVLSLTYFIDYFIWELHPFGYRLTNVFFHIGCVFLVYLCFRCMFRSKEKALLGAFLFGLHPLVSETVCMIGFRADLIATFFALLAFWFFLKEKPWLLFVCFFLALFAKESVVLFPVILFMYDYLNRRKKQWFSYAGCSMIVGIYLIIYFFVFPNTAMQQAQLMGGSYVTHLLTMAYIFTYYVSAFFNPVWVRVLPPVSAPNIHFLGILDWVWIGICISFFVVLTVYSIGKRKTYAFFLCFFFLAFIPVSNIIPLVNPYANRFMYLPMIGLAGILTVWIHGLSRFRSSIQWVRIVRMSFVSLCLFLTIPMNMAFSNNVMLAQYLVDDNPDDPMGYLFMGLNYMDAGKLEQAKDMIVQGQKRGLRDPRAYYILGWYHRADLKNQKELFHACLNQYASYIKCYTGLARAYLLEHNLPMAEKYALQSLDVQPTFHGYHYLMQIKMMQQDTEAVQALFLQSQKDIRNGHLTGALRHLSVAAKPEQLPVDILF